MLAERLWHTGESYCSGWNFGPNESDAKPVSWLVQRLVELWGNGASWATDGSTHPHEANFLKLDVSKARQLLGWVPVLNLDVALANTVEWYKAHQKGMPMRELIIKQIEEYMGLASHD